MNILLQFESRLAHGAVQLALTAGQLYNAYGAFIPSKYKPLVAAAVGLLQAYLAFVNHGTSTTSTAS